MKQQINEKRLLLLVNVLSLGLPTVASANGSDSDGPERNIEIEFFSVGDSKSGIGDSQVSTSGILIETEYERNNMTFSFNYERWKYDWINPENLPFVSGTAGVPWTTFNTLQFGFAYEQEINEQWEFEYYIEAESSFEEQASASGEYEVGVDFTYELSSNWAFTINTNFEYLDAEGGEFGVDLEIQWNHDKKDGWSGEFEISSEFPETHLTYHFTRELSTTLFYNDSGTSTIRLSDSSPVIGMQGGYLEDEYNAVGIQLAYEVAHEGYLSFTFQQNSGRELSFTDSSGRAGATYEFGDSSEISIMYSYTF